MNSICIKVYKQIRLFIFSAGRANKLPVNKKNYRRHHNSRLPECFVSGMGEQILGPSSHHIGPRTPPVHLLPVDRPVRTAKHPAAQPDGPVGVRETGWTTYHGSCLAREDDGCTTPAQAVFGSPLILPGHFLDSPELLQKTS
jgi:hypothetical protein